METERIAVTRRSGSVWIMLPDSITMDNSKAIENEIEKNCNGTIGRVVFDFSKVNNLYSSGLGLMIRIRKYVQERGGNFCIVNISGRLHEMLIALNLDRVIPIYATDVEYEISQEDTWNNTKKSVNIGFLFVPQIEGSYYRINISGEMISTHDLSGCQNFQPISDTTLYIFDLTSLEQVDCHGAYQFRELTSRIAQIGAKCRAFGAEEFLRETLNLFDALRYVMFYKDEVDALSGNNPL